MVSHAGPLVTCFSLLRPEALRLSLGTVLGCRTWLPDGKGWAWVRCACGRHTGMAFAQSPPLLELPLGMGTPTFPGMLRLGVCLTTTHVS